MAVGLALASNTTTSTLSAIFVSTLLTSPKIPSLIALSSERLADAYAAMTSLLKKYSIPYIPSYAGLYLFARVEPNAQSWEDEANMVESLKQAGVLVSAGKAYHGPEGDKGWVRIGFAVESVQLKEAIRRMEEVFDKRVNYV